MNSNNLLIRPSTYEDCPLFLSWELNPNVKEFFTIDSSYDYEILLRDFFRRNDDDTHLQFTILHKHDNVPIGRIWISRIDTHNKSLDITRIYIGNDDYRGKGYGKEALILLLDYLFNTLNMHRVSLDYLSGNEVAKRLYESVGFKAEGTLRQCASRDGEWLDLNLMSLLRFEYEEI